MKHTLRTFLAIVFFLCIAGSMPAAATCVVSGDTTLCAGGITSFVASGGVSYVWSGPGGFTSTSPSTGNISVAGTYAVTVTDGSGATSTCSSVLTVLPVCDDNVLCTTDG